jgi:hypothetical protein
MDKAKDVPELKFLKDWRFTRAIRHFQNNRDPAHSRWFEALSESPHYLSATRCFLVQQVPSALGHALKWGKKREILRNTQ